MSLLPIREFSENHLWPSERSLRMLVFHNGPAMEEAGALVRFGKRLLIDPERFFEWVKNSSKKGE